MRTCGYNIYLFIQVQLYFLLLHNGVTSYSFQGISMANTKSGILFLSTANVTVFKHINTVSES